jgi:hypothetical protein
LYTCGRAVLHQRALAIIESRIYQGEPPARALAVPDAANPWRWRAVVETGDFYAVQDLQLGADFDPTRATVFHKPDPDPALDVARRAETFREFLAFSQYPMWRVSPAPEPENSKLVEVFDMRFGTPAAPGFMASALVTSKLQVLQTAFHYGRLRPR